MSIYLDKYYTPIKIANHCFDVVDKIIGLNNVSDIIEPACGNGAFCHYKRKPDILIDICPECDNAIKDDFLTHRFYYKKNRLIIGNPPFGRTLKIALAFYNKSCEISDYIAFILPISQFNNTHSFYKFDLIHSEDLGLQKYSDVNLHCCFNIYKRPANVDKHKMQKIKFDGITFYRQDKKEYENILDYDLRMCYWGYSAGKIIETDKKYAGEWKIKINDKHPQKEQIVKILKTTNWEMLIHNIAEKRLHQYEIFSELKKQGIKEMNFDTQLNLF